MRGETVDEITGACAPCAPNDPGRAPDDAIDIVGTGGDGAGTYNVSTCAALVAAGAGLKIAKHGNRALSSKSGAADALMALGVNIEIPPQKISECIDRGRCRFHVCASPSRRHAPCRSDRVELGTRTVFNLLGPISNPAGTRRQVVGVFARDWVEPMAHVFNNLGAERVWVVHGSDGLDELTTTGPSFVAELRDGAVSTFEVSPEDAGLSLAKPEDLKGGDAEVNAQAIRDVLSGSKSAFRDIVAFTAAAALVVGGKADDLKAGTAAAFAAIDGGQAQSALDLLVEISNAG